MVSAWFGILEAMFTPGQLIRHQRLRGGWTQEELAEAAGVGQGEHRASARARSDEDDRRLLGVPPAWRDGEIDLAAVLSPQVSETPLRLHHLLPLLELLRGQEFV